MKNRNLKTFVLKLPASPNRALVALHVHYAVTITHLENTSTGKKEDAAKEKGILHVLKSEQFVKYLHFMIDVTSVLSKLSVQFQKDDISINEVVCGVERSITELKELDRESVTGTMRTMVNWCMAKITNKS